jgi:hypothetical protein
MERSRSAPRRARLKKATTTLGVTSLAGRATTHCARRLRKEVNASGTSELDLNKFCLAPCAQSAKLGSVGVRVCVGV